MPTPAYVKFTSNNDGEIAGSVEIEGREETSEVHEFHSNVYFPTDIHRGSPSGKRIHSPAVLIKEVDKSSPILYNHLTEGTVFTKIVINWYKVQDDGTELLYFMHTIEHARLVGMKMMMPNVKDPAKQTFGHLEELSIAYRRITWSWLDGGIEATDDWIESQ
ncbi:MAG: type VI secretion system tube protein TssD [Bacteroidota bacterium]